MGEGGDRPVGVAGELLPDAFPQGDLGELAVQAQPVLDLGEGERGAGLGAADRLGEVGVPAAPVADGGAADPGQPRDPRGGHFCRAVPLLRHPALLPSGFPLVRLWRRAYRRVQDPRLHARVHAPPCEPC
ncbi:predicted protein [Streptomyces viridosporus ATCC 14672]|uniref:Predicted protein n=1 Tax=Streptomyces viridosporus (strain ATCC 14672 / DSM 40746 / JCM 4963 / KCTC 9882 / NRRL B-12104 / FH 1290) TaxID=566461 RepID=D5ZXS3_STRV1|nr:predicted protein [Streptomyces viridosporus ATCC 14672]